MGYLISCVASGVSSAASEASSDKATPDSGTLFSLHSQCSSHGRLLSFVRTLPKIVNHGEFGEQTLNWDWMGGYLFCRDGDYWLFRLYSLLPGAKSVVFGFSALAVSLY